MYPVSEVGLKTSGQRSANRPPARGYVAEWLADRFSEYLDGRTRLQKEIILCRSTVRAEGKWGRLVTTILRNLRCLQPFLSYGQTDFTLRLVKYG